MGTLHLRSDEPGPLQDSDVLLHAREGHVELLGKVGDRRVALAMCADGNTLCSIATRGLARGSAFNFLSAGAVMFSAPVPVWADCPLSLIQIGDVMDNQVLGPSATRHVSDGYGTGDAWFLNWGDSLGYNINFGGGGSGSMEVRGVFKVL